MQPVRDVEIDIDHLPMILGRGENGPNRRRISESRRVSRDHVSISWDRDRGCFALDVLSKNSVVVDRTSSHALSGSYSYSICCLLIVNMRFCRGCGLVGGVMCTLFLFKNAWP